MKLTGEKEVLDLQEQIKSDIIWENYHINYFDDLLVRNLMKHGNKISSLQHIVKLGVQTMSRSTPEDYKV